MSVKRMSGKDDKPTQKTIARLTGFSVPTVSRALIDAPDIKQSTKRLVNETAKKIGYVPNRAGVHLRTGRTNVISLAMSTEYDLSNHLGSLISGITLGLKETSFHLNVTPYFSSEDLLLPIRYVVENGTADALIFDQTRPEDPRVAYLLDKGFPFACHGRTDRSDQHSYYDYDNAIVGKLGVEALIKNGRTNLLLIPPPMTMSYAQHMVDGAKAAARLGGIALSIHPTLKCTSGPSEFLHSIQETLRESPDIDGIICASADGAIGALGGVEAAGRTLSKCIDIFSKDSVDILHKVRQDFLVIKENTRHAGEFLAKAAVQAIMDTDAAPAQFLEVPTYP